MECVAHLEGFYSSHPAVLFELFLIRQFWLSSRTPRKKLLLHIVHIRIIILYVVSYDRMLLIQSKKHLDPTMCWSTIGTHHLPYLESSFSHSITSHWIMYWLMLPSNCSPFCNSHIYRISNIFLLLIELGI
jgi:hypothetical protein